MRKIIYIIFVIVFLLSACSKKQVNSAAVVDTKYDYLYNDIIDNIYKDDFVFEDGCVSKYVGYQLYDRDNDKINELYIFCMHNVSSDRSTYGVMISKPFIRFSYRIINNKPELYYEGTPRGGQTRDDCYFALSDDKIAHLKDSYSDEDIQIIDKNNNIELNLHCDYAYVAGNSENDIYKIDGMVVSKAKYNKEVKNINSKIGYFPTQIYN